MKPPRLDARLRLVADCVPPCALAADIGADHGKLSAWLLWQKRCDRMIVSDISAASRAKARALFNRLGLLERVAFSQAPGLYALSQPVQAVIISGLGGGTMAEMLRYLGYAVVAVDGGRAALACCDSARDPACCVLLDLRMPDLDGVETLRLLRERGVHAPVLVVSGLGDYGNERELTELGVTRVLQKPVSLKQLAAELEGVDGGHRC